MPPLSSCAQEISAVNRKILENDAYYTYKGDYSAGPGSKRVREWRGVKEDRDPVT